MEKSQKSAKQRWREQRHEERAEERFWSFFTDPIAISPRAIAAAHRPAKDPAPR